MPANQIGQITDALGHVGDVLFFRDAIILLVRYVTS